MSERGGESKLLIAATLATTFEKTTMRTMSEANVRKLNAATAAPGGAAPLRRSR